MFIVNLDTHNAIVGALKRTFSRSPTITNFLRKHRREEVWFKKDGSKAQKPHVFYKCAECNKEFNSTQIQVDHIQPVVPLNIPSKHLSLDMFIERLFCDETNLQILCKEHHRAKSKAENALRQKWLLKTKYIVYVTINKINCKKYIGVHKCEDYDDIYYGSGTILKQALKKYDVKNFYRNILFVYDNPEEAYKKEKELVTKELIESDEYYNVAIGGVGNSNGNTEFNKIKVICHQTGELFDSINAAAEYVKVSASSICKSLNKIDSPVKNLHFFSADLYDPMVTVTFPTHGRRIVCLNNKKQYLSVKNAANDLNLNYDSLRNALIEKTVDNFFTIDNYHFLYAEEFDDTKKYSFTQRMVKCVELNRLFNTCIEAAIFLKCKKINFAAIAIGKAARNNSKMYKYSWQYVFKQVPI